MIFYVRPEKNRRKKSRVDSKKLRTARREHEKFLVKMGVNLDYKSPDPTPLKLNRPQKQLPEVHIKDMDWSPCLKKNIPVITSDIIIGQAYNKGNYQVLSKQDAADPNTGKK